MKTSPSLLLMTRHGALGSSSRLRLMAYRPWLEQAGFRVEVSPFFDDAYLARRYVTGQTRPGDILRAYSRRLLAMARLRRYRLLWIEKELLPFLPGRVDGIVRHFGVPYVLDYDDAIFHRYDQHPSQTLRRLLGRRLWPLMRGASLVTAGNDYLAHYARSAGAADVLVLPTVVDTSKYGLGAEPPDNELRVGWIGSPSTAHYLSIVSGALTRLSRQRPLRLVVIGASDLPPMDIPLELHPWSVDTEADLLGTLHIGIMPLADGPWERGKCGYKLIQYMACGKPVVASPVGVNKTLVTPDVGRLAADEEEWFQALRDLAADATLRQSLGRAGRALAERRYALQTCGPQLAERLAKIASTRS